MDGRDANDIYQQRASLVHDALNGCPVRPSQALRDLLKQTRDQEPAYWMDYGLLYFRTIFESLQKHQLCSHCQDSLASEIDCVRRILDGH